MDIHKQIKYQFALSICGFFKWDKYNIAKILRKGLMNKSDISRRLARLMREHGVSQSGLSRGASVPQPTINRILNEKTKEPRRDSVIRIANFFGVPPESLYQESRAAQEESDAVARVYHQLKSLRPNQQKEVLRMVKKDLDNE